MRSTQLTVISQRLGRREVCNRARPQFHTRPERVKLPKRNPIRCRQPGSTPMPPNNRRRWLLRRRCICADAGTVRNWRMTDAVPKLSTLLDEHLALWPGADSVDQARLWLAAQQKSDGEMAAAIETWLQIRPGSKQFASAVELMRATAIDQWSGQSNDAAAVRDAAVTMIDRLQLLAADDASNSATATIAELALRYNAASLTAVEVMLKQSIERAPDSARAGEWAGWLGIVRAAQPGGSIPAGSANQFEIDEATADRMLPVIEKLSERVTPQSRQNLMQFTIALAERRLNEKLTPQANIRWRVARATANSQLGSHTEAIDELRALASAAKFDAVIQLAMAEALAADPASQADALKQWRLIAKRSPAQSKVWFEAKYQTAELLLTGGEVDQGA